MAPPAPAEFGSTVSAIASLFRKVDPVISV